MSRNHPERSGKAYGRDDKTKKRSPEQLKIAKICYGSKSLAECMESVIRIHTNHWK